MNLELQPAEQGGLISRSFHISLPTQLVLRELAPGTFTIAGQVALQNAARRILFR